MAKVIIGGKEYIIPELNFAALERAWPYIEESMLTVDPIKGASTGISIIAAGLMETPEFKAEDYGIPVELGLIEDQVHRHLVVYLKKQLKSSELKNISPCIDEIIKEGGLEPEEGEIEAAPVQGTEQILSTETAVATSLSSLPPGSKEEAGTP